MVRNRRKFPRRQWRVIPAALLRHPYNPRQFGPTPVTGSARTISSLFSAPVVWARYTTARHTRLDRDVAIKILVEPDESAARTVAQPSRACSKLPMRTSAPVGRSAGSSEKARANKVSSEDGSSGCRPVSRIHFPAATAPSQSSALASANGRPPARISRRYRERPEVP